MQSGMFKGFGALLKGTSAAQSPFRPQSCCQSPKQGFFWPLNSGTHSRGWRGARLPPFLLLLHGGSAQLQPTPAWLCINLDSNQSCLFKEHLCRRQTDPGWAKYKTVNRWVFFFPVLFVATRGIHRWIHGTGWCDCSNGAALLHPQSQNQHDPPSALAGSLRSALLALKRGTNSNHMLEVDFFYSWRSREKQTISVNVELAFFFNAAPGKASVCSLPHELGNLTHCPCLKLFFFFPLN